MKLLPLVCFLFSVSGPARAELPLSAEGQFQAAAHRYIFETVAPTGDPEFTGEKGGRKLRRITISRPGIPVSGVTDIPLPGGIAPSLQLFRHIELHGTGMNNLDGHVELLPTGEGSGMHHSLRTATSLRVQLPGLPPGAATPDAVFALRIKGTAEVSHIDLVPPGSGLSENFDPLPFQNLGYDKPPRTETLTLDLGHTLSIGGVTEVDRHRTFRIYGQPMQHPEAMADFMKEHDFSPGRQILKIAPAFQDYPKVKLTEDPARPGSGWHDPKFFTEKHQGTTYKGMDDRWPGLPFAMCFDSWPQFQAVGTGPHDNGRGTPAADKFEPASAITADILENQLKYSGRTATWWEVKNEGSIKSEWDYHWRKDTDSWKLLADFHNLVSDKIRSRPATKNVKIGGPASAWMQMQAGGFDLWRNQARFMDLTSGKLDFYSHHFYENAATVGAYSRRQSGYSNYLHGRLTTTLDMFSAHMHATGNVRPILVTEMGGLNVGRSQADYWLRLRAMSAFFTQLLARPHQVELAVPFIFTHVPWRPDSGYAIFVPKPGKRGNSGDLDDYDATPNIHFPQLWSSFRGTYLPVGTASRTTYAAAAIEGATVRIALTNISCDRVTYDLGDLPEGTGVQQRRLRYHDGQVSFHPDAPVDPTAVPLDAEETTVVTLTLPAVPGDRPTLTSSTYYAAATASEPDTLFTIATPDTASPSGANLVIGLSRNSGFTGTLTATLNGNAYSQDLTPWAKDVSNLFESATLEVDPAHLLEKNAITLTLPPNHEGAVITSVHLSLTQ